MTVGGDVQVAKGPIVDTGDKVERVCSVTRGLACAVPVASRVGEEGKIEDSKKQQKHKKTTEPHPIDSLPAILDFQIWVVRFILAIGGPNYAWLENTPIVHPDQTCYTRVYV